MNTQKGSSPARTGGDSSAAACIDRLVLIDGRSLERECLIRCIQVKRRRLVVEGYETPEEWHASADPSDPPAVILFNAGMHAVSDPEVSATIKHLVETAGPTPVIVLSQSESLREMIAAVDCGARGYIPASVGIDVIFEAARLASVGGIFLPTASVLALRDSITSWPEPTHGIEEHFTPRQAAVAHALRRGKANKIIAYELNLCESTVKVHVRNIMKKLKAKNRTQVAFMASELLRGELG